MAGKIIYNGAAKSRSEINLNDKFHMQITSQNIETRIQQTFT